MAAARNPEQAEYDRRWGEAQSSAEHVGYTRFFVRFMAQWVDRQPADHRAALDVGCGPGLFSGELVRLGCQVTGIDLSPVVSDVPQFRGYLEDGRQGVVFDHRGPAAAHLAAALRRRIADAPLAAEFGAAAEQRAAQSSYPAVAEESLREFARLLA